MYIFIAAVATVTQAGAWLVSQPTSLHTADIYDRETAMSSTVVTPKAVSDQSFDAGDCFNEVINEVVTILTIFCAIYFWSHGSKRSVVPKTITEDSDHEASEERAAPVSKPPQRRQSAARRQPRERSQAHIALNQSICAMNCPGEILIFVHKHKHELNEVNIATAVHRVAKAAKRGSPGWSAAEILLSKEWATLKVLVTQRAVDFNPQGLANTLWAMASLRVSVSDPLLATVASAAAPKVSQFTPQALANAAWACAMLHFPHGELLQAVERSTLMSLAKFSTQDTANVIWALTSLKVASPQFLDQVGTAIAPTMHCFKPAEILNVVWGYSQQRVKNVKVLGAAAAAVSQRAEIFAPHALAKIRDACAEAGVVTSF